MPTVQPRYCIITGAASGIGEALTLRLAAEKAVLTLVDLNREKLESVAEQARAAGATVRCEVFDVTQASAWADLRNRLSADWPRLDLLVNNAGVAAVGEIGQLSYADWDWVLEVDLHAPIRACRELLPWLRQNPGSHIVNTSSIAAYLSVPGMAAYNVAKAGLVSYSETIYAELRPLQIGVTVVCPGFVSTNLLRNGRFYDDGLKRDAEKLMYSARITPDEVAAAILHGVRKKKLYVITGRRAKWLARLKRWAPMRWHNFIARIHARRQK